MPTEPDEVAGARAVLEAAWDPERRYSFPNRKTYPHLWLWDSCFHAIAWAALGDRRCLAELASVFDAQLPDGFVPHMRYARPTIPRGPLGGSSSFTQPPVYAHAAAAGARRGFDPPPGLVASVRAGLDWLWRHRMGADGLLVVVHPWETGADDSPRWDSWVGMHDWERDRWTAFDLDLVERVTFSPAGAAVGSTAFVAAPAAFNALCADAAAELHAMNGDAEWRRRAADLADAIDRQLWDGNEGLWADRAVVGGGDSVRAPTLDGALPALVTADRDRARTVLARLTDPSEFRGRYGLRYVAASHHSYDGAGYWRGSSWMQLHYLACRAALRWEDAALAGYLADTSRRAALASGFAEHWDPDTGEGLGAIPQTWSALVVAIEQLAAGA